jgi:hypothetical protein
MKNLAKALLCPVFLLLALNSANAQSNACSDRSLNNFSRKVDRQELFCNRAQDRVEQWNIRKADAITRLQVNESIANTRESTSSFKCKIREAFPGECRARRRKRAYVEMLGYLEQFYDRRLAPLHRRANRDCQRFADFQQAFQNRVDACQAT